MSKHVCSLHVGIVGHYEPLVHHFALTVQVLKDLYSFGARSCAHIEYFVLGLDIKQSYRYHADLFLPEYTSILSFSDQKLMEILEYR